MATCRPRRSSERPRSAATTDRPHAEALQALISRCKVPRGFSLNELPSERTQPFTNAEDRNRVRFGQTAPRLSSRVDARDLLRARASSAERGRLEGAFEQEGAGDVGGTIAVVGLGWNVATRCSGQHGLRTRAPWDGSPPATRAPRCSTACIAPYGRCHSPSSHIDGQLTISAPWGYPTPMPRKDCISQRTLGLASVLSLPRALPVA